MSTARRQFTDEFKREAVELLASSGRPLSQIAGELGIAVSRLRAWRNRGNGGQAGMRTNGSPDRALLDFLQSTYEAAADAGKWESAALECARRIPGVPRAIS